MTALSQEEQERLWQEAETKRKAEVKVIKRNLTGGPLHGQVVVIPEDVKTHEVGWWTQHYVLQENGTMRFEVKAEVKEPAPR